MRERVGGGDQGVLARHATEADLILDDHHITHVKPGVVVMVMVMGDG